MSALATPPGQIAPFANEPYTDFTNPENAQRMQIALAKVRSEFGKEYDLLITGERRKSGAKFDSLNPSCPSEVVGIHQKGSEQDARDAVEAVRVLPEFRPEVILLDLRMPHLDGEGFLRGMGGLPASKRVPVVLISAKEDLQQIALRTGAAGYLSKPFEMPELLAHIEAKLRRPHLEEREVLGILRGVLRADPRRGTPPQALPRLAGLRGGRRPGSR